MVKVIIPRKYGSYKIYDGVIKQIDNTNRLLIFKRNIPYRDGFLFYSCLDDRIELLDWLLYKDSEIDTNLTKILLYFLKTKRSIVVKNLEKTKDIYGNYKRVYGILDSVEEAVKITNKTNIIWKLKDCTT